VKLGTGVVGGFPPPKAVVFDGTNDYLTRGGDLTGIADGKQGTFSCWVDMNGGDGSLQHLFVLGSSFGVRRLADGNWNIQGQTSAGANTLQLSTTGGGYTAAFGWAHILASWDLTNSANRHLYVNDVSNISVGTYNNNNIDYTAGDAAVGALTTGLLKLNADVAELWFSTTYLDLGVESNRRKFVSAGGRPAFLGTNGSKPTGSQPIVYLKGPASAFATNLGSGGNFSVTGALTNSSSSPHF
jgi:hypothetical protein